MESSDKSNDDDFNQILLSSVRQGCADTLEKYLLSVQNPNLYLNRLYDDSNDQKCTILMIACLNGYEDIVCMLLKYFQPDLEIPNDILLDDNDFTKKMYFDVSVLWVSSAINKFSIVKLLVGHGANINYRTKTKSTPLRCTCRYGNIDIARYLIENGADIYATNENNETILMASANYNHVDLVKLFVDKYHFDVNQCDDDGRSVLYDAVHCKSLEITKILLENGARNFPAEIDKKSPLLKAAEEQCIDIMDVISKYCPLIEQIEAKEYYASFIIIRDNENVSNLEKAFEYLSKALQLRIAHNLPKNLLFDPIEAFDNRQECQTLEQLEEIHYNIDAMYIEALLILERILGPNNLQYRHTLTYRGAELVDFGQCQKGLNLWIYELRLCHQHSVPIDDSQLRETVSLISQMLIKSIPVSFKNLLLLTTIIIEVVDQDGDQYQYNLNTLLYLITIIAKFSNEISTNEKDRQQLYECILKFNRSHQQFCLLSWCLDEWTAFVDDYYIKKICQYPCLQTAHLLIQCGANVNQIDNQGNTPLHRFVLNNKSSSDESILKLLFDAGVHIDYINSSNNTAFDLATNTMLKYKLKNQMQLSLKCLCARLIRQNNVSFQGYLSTSLVNFVIRH